MQTIKENSIKDMFADILRVFGQNSRHKKSPVINL